MKTNSIEIPQLVNKTAYEDKLASKSKVPLEKVVINLFHTKYPLLEDLCKKDFQFNISKKEKEEDWDIYWSDTVSYYFEWC